MTQLRTSMIRVSIAVGGLGCGLTGCVQSALSTDTGDPARSGWSATRRVAGHVGELVHLTLTVEDQSTADPFSEPRPRYAVAYVGDRLMDLSPDLQGDYPFSATLPATVTEPLRIRAELYQQRQKRDAIIVGDQFVHREGGTDQRDILLASDEILVDVAQSRLQMLLPEPADHYDWDTAKLILISDRGQSQPIFRRTDTRHGFIITSASASCVLNYEPPIDQINKTGTTDAVLSIHHIEAGPKEIRAMFPTP